MAAFQVGDLVWAHVLGYPKWPGQVILGLMASTRLSSEVSASQTRLMKGLTAQFTQYQGHF